MTAWKSEVETVIGIARRLMETLTAKGMPRLSASSKPDQLMPTARFEAKEQAFLARLLSASSMLLPVFSQDWVKPFFHQADSYRPQMVFKDPRHLSAWLGLFPDALPMDSFTVAVAAPEASMEGALSAWRKELGPRCRIEPEPTKRSKSRSSHGRGLLRSSAMRRW